MMAVEQSTSTAVPSKAESENSAVTSASEEPSKAPERSVVRRSTRYLLTGDIAAENGSSGPASARLRAVAKSVSLEDIFDLSKQQTVVAGRDKFIAAIEERAWRERRSASTSRLRANERFIVDPRKSTGYKAWGLVVLVAMLYTAIVTPYECAFHMPPPPCSIDLLFVINRVMDVIFYVDMVITFRLAYFDPRSGRWVREGRTIAQRYLRGFFVIDLVSVIPLWPTAFYGCADVLDKDDSLSDEALLASGTSSAARNVRLLRLLRLTRLIKASRVLLSLLEDIMTNTFEATYANLKLLKLALALFFFSHWQACIFGLSKFFTNENKPAMWYQVLAQRDEDLSASPSAWDVYILAFYASVGILTGIGADDVLPVTREERLMVVCLKLISGSFWAFGIGAAAGIAATLDPNATLFHTTMDQLNFYLRERKLPKAMRMMCREYFTNAREVHQVKDDASLLGQMTPKLLSIVAIAANKRWLDQVWFLRDLGNTGHEQEFIARLSVFLRVSAFIKQEAFPLGRFFILRKGIVVKFWRFLGPGKVFGEDSLLPGLSLELIDHSQAIALTYSEAYSLTQDDFVRIAEASPGVRTLVSRKMNRFRWRRALVAYLCKIHNDENPNAKISPRSYVPGGNAFPKFSKANAKALPSTQANSASMTTAATSVAVPVTAPVALKPAAALVIQPPPDETAAGTTPATEGHGPDALRHQQLSDRMDKMALALELLTSKLNLVLEAKTQV